MNDRVETVSSLAIIEQKPQKTGGCVGIFFQLFDWNSRFAKKKLFQQALIFTQSKFQRSLEVIRSQSFGRGFWIVIGATLRIETKIRCFRRRGVLPRSKFNSMQSNKVAATNGLKNLLNCSLSDSPRPQVPARMDKCKFETGRRVCSRQNDSVSPVRKRRPINISRQNESSSFLSSVSSKELNRLSGFTFDPLQLIIHQSALYSE